MANPAERPISLLSWRLNAIGSEKLVTSTWIVFSNFSSLPCLADVGHPHDHRLSDGLPVHASRNG